MTECVAKDHVTNEEMSVLLSTKKAKGADKLLALINSLRSVFAGIKNTKKK